ncbi:hydroxysqualene dehydroxylase HpnE [Ideonella sp. 4Y16]|uniref:Hydroxysqualene dehydroxylase HpnE n=1 Tax=Ideonella alba TaxID=2824118 RepID=A0A940YD62_9BURK|nr:hydroxysqualene dehydroxylase HpnE [Ideonella alba]MBQ0931988.1 hydroxysqualene dehydroxylase HpnE [Ideonella alba]MBQ0942503.1 hydroxysqualene dehydroxylase HpnE [Ideonella alba]
MAGPLTTAPQRVAVVGAGWAGLAAAVELVDAGHAVTLIDMAAQPGGRARSTPSTTLPQQDNGQHILIGAYRDTLAMMRRVGVDPDAVLLRTRLSLRDPQGRGLALGGGPATVAFALGVLRWQDCPWPDRLALLRLALGWRLGGFRCEPDQSVQEFAQGCPPSVYQALLEPLCVAALNTPAPQASAQVMLTVLRDALFGGPGSADLLLPRAPLDALFPRPALAWLMQRGVAWHPRRPVRQLRPAPGAGWQVDDLPPVDQVVLACSATEAARLVHPLAPHWSRQALAIRYQPIATAWIDAPPARWTAPMLRLSDGPAQFAFDLSALGGPPGCFTLVASGAADLAAQGAAAAGQALLAHWQRCFGPDARLRSVRIEKRATFACTPGLARPAARVAPSLWAAGDYVEGPYPATLEGAVRTGRQVALAVAASGAGQVLGMKSPST